MEWDYLVAAKCISITLNYVGLLVQPPLSGDLVFIWNSWNIPKVLLLFELQVGLNSVVL